MIFCRFRAGDEVKYGIVENHAVREISPDFFGAWEAVGEPYAMPEVEFLAPVRPGKIVAVGLNYRDHAKEMSEALPKEPLFFLKPATAVIGPNDAILYPGISKRVDYEAELAVVIKKMTKGVKAEEAADYILGYTCLNDVTARDLQKADGQWSRSKGFDTFAPLGPWIVTDLDLKYARIQSFLNGELKQDGNPGEMIFDIPRILAHISQGMTLEPGDVISTGTPPGIGPMQPGDRIDVRIEGIGLLSNVVAAA